MKKGSSQKMAEDDDKIGYEYVYTVIGAVALVGVGLSLLALIALIVFLAGWLPMS